MEGYQCQNSMEGYQCQKSTLCNKRSIDSICYVPGIGNRDYSTRYAVPRTTVVVS